VRSIALRGLWARKLRTFLTAFAIVLGIATVSGTFVLTDSITHAFDTIFSNIYRGTDASITGKSAVSVDATTDLPPFDESLLGKVKDLPSVQAAIGGVADTANLIGSNGKVISFGGAPHLGFSVDPTQARFNSLSLVEGKWPGPEPGRHRPFDRGQEAHLGGRPHRRGGAGQRSALHRVRSGQVRHQRARHRRRHARRVRPEERSAPLSEGRQARPDPCLEEARRQRGPAALRHPVDPAAADAGEERAEQADTDAGDTNAFTSFLQKFLLSFGIIALFVGSFVIANSLSITVTQRTREFATLRTLGATRRQIRRSVLLESFVMGLSPPWSGCSSASGWRSSFSGSSVRSDSRCRTQASCSRRGRSSSA
jgi:putative ABC transport system permease protein